MSRTLLITGAAGKIGSFLISAFAGNYELRLTDIHEPSPMPPYPFSAVDLVDLERVRPLCRGIDTVIHLGADPRTFAPWETLLPANVVGAYNIFQAAAEAGCRRVIFASSINAVAGYPTETQINTSMPLRPLNLYGATKAWGEVLGRLYADQHNLSVICLRFGAVVAPTNREWIYPGNPFLSSVLTLDDCVRLVIASIEAPDDLRFGVYHGVSNNRYKRLDISDARAQIGYDPQDDAFALGESDVTTV
ncbi:MAG TPA: NAD(P)-dependent oxidoreductase [Roseiflexaceae bacterium]|nr:NAD(P)-dependent oxidoreductase [Roseiflexaceae bacterium]HMP42786.1 NAD(P)-dependent oxidoreductase [Roseiflexaceae bacterium]